MQQYDNRPDLKEPLDFQQTVTINVALCSSASTNSKEGIEELNWTFQKTTSSLVCSLSKLQPNYSLFV